MSVPYLVQLGTLNLELVAGPSGGTFSDFRDLEIETLRSFDVPEDQQDAVTALDVLMGHPGVELVARYRRDVARVIIRISLLPSDGLGSVWKAVTDRRDARRKSLQRLFYHLKDGWDGDGEWVLARGVEDNYRMAELYAAVPSPPEPFFAENSMISSTDREVCSRLANLEEPQGVQTRMYQYQFRSVSRMLQMEMDPSSLVDPLFISFDEAGREGKYYVNLGTWDIQWHPSQYQLPRGGILCEQMGVGKTLMCLALITATLHQPTQPPTVSLDPNYPLTQHTLRTYPFSSYSIAREALSLPKSTTELRLPSLADLCANILVARDHSAKRDEFAPQTLLDRLEEPTFYYKTPLEDDCVREAKRKYLTRFTETVPLANTTLVVVPRILLGQWKDEIHKHVAPKTLKVLAVQSKILPSVEEMMKHDIVLIDTNRFGQEEALRRKNLDIGESEFAKARWKRIILDEGHVAGDASPSNAMRLAISLSVERRWVVSGTPSKHLQQGGELELGSMSQAVDSRISLKSDDKIPQWSLRDLTDVKRLGSMMGGFLAVEPFATDKVFAERVTAQIRGPQGPKFGAVRRLQYLMSALMVKHAPRVIDSEAMLPPSELSTKMLRFHPMQRITYNVLAALVASNVYTSNFEDRDYFLHKNNTGSFNAVIRNFHLATFWYSARHMGIDKSLERTLSNIEDSQDLSPAARSALQEAAQHLRIALETPGWLEWMDNAVSAAYDVDSVPPFIRACWSDCYGLSDGVLAADSLHALRALNKPGVSHDMLEDAGLEHRKRKIAMAIVDDREDKKLVQEKKSPKSKQAVTEETEPSQAAAHAPTPIHKRVISKRKRAEGDAVDVHLDEATQNAYQDLTIQSDGPRPLPSVIRIQSRSTKLNFVIEEILSSPSDKFVIFGDLYELGHVTEALDLLDVKSCFVGTAVSVAKRAEALREFEEPQTRVCLLDLKLGARGLNLVVANRLILLAPVWSLDVQAQAIKRIHRIGQTRPTKVQILVTEGTFEEDIAKRSSSSRTEKEEKLYSRAMIENPRFVYVEHKDDTSFPIRFTPEKPEMVSPSTATPTDNMPITPLEKPRIDSVRVETSPTPVTNDEAARSTSGLDKKLKAGLKRETVEGEEMKPKKRARVAFA